jgi:hypothetical protein
MDDRFDRRELLLHLGDILHALNYLTAKAKPGISVTQVLQKDDALQTFEFLRALAPQMTVAEFGAGVASAFSQWPKELLETELNRDALASAVKDNLFQGNVDGWNAYVAHIRKDVPWFGIGPSEVKGAELPEPVSRAAGETTTAEANAHVLSAVGADVHNEKRGWPWPEPRLTS